MSGGTLEDVFFFVEKTIPLPPSPIQNSRNPYISNAGKQIATILQQKSVARNYAAYLSAYDLVERPPDDKKMSRWDDRDDGGSAFLR